MAPLPDSPFDIALVGAGRVGTAVAMLLKERGHRIVGISSRTETSARAAAARLDAPVIAFGELPDSNVVLLGVPDHALAEVALSLPRGSRERVLIHHAGSVGIGPLEGVEGAAALCALHPVQACPDVDTATARLPGSAWGVTCSEGAREWAHRMVSRDLHGHPVDVAEEDRALWHAAAVTTSNGISALMATGEALLAAIGIDAPERVLGPIAAGTVMNAREVGGGAASLTGPVVRKEIDVIRRHLAAVRGRAPGTLDAYVHTLRSIVAGAEAAGRIDASDAAALMELLDVA